MQKFQGKIENLEKKVRNLEKLGNLEKNWKFGKLEIDNWIIDLT